MAKIPNTRGVVTAPMPEPLSGVGQASHGVVVGSTGLPERWLYAPKPYSPAGGVYDVFPDGTWTRATDLDAPADFADMPHLYAEEGDNRMAGSEWYYAGAKNPALSVDPLPFVMRSYGTAWAAGTGMEVFGNEMRLIQRAGLAGTRANPIVTTNESGVVTDISSGADAQTTLFEGLGVSYAGPRSLVVGKGAILVPDVGLLGFPEDVPLNNLALPAGVWQYVYAYSTGTGAALEVSNVAPAPPYRGNSRLKTGDPTRRYVPRSAFYAVAANTARRFEWVGTLCRWKVPQADLSAGDLNPASAGYQEFSVAPFQPPHSEAIEIFAVHRNPTNNTNLHLSGADDGLTTLGGSELGQLVSDIVNTATSSRTSFSGTLLVGNGAVRYRVGLGGAFNAVFVHGFYEDS